MFMPNAMKNPSAVEQISSMIERYNQLVEDIKYLETLQRRKDLEISLLKKQMTSELSELKAKVFDLKELLIKAEKYRNSVGRDFKQIIKTDSLNKLSRRIDIIDFENKMPREEFNHLIERNF
ncbi:MAG: hypothetical protein ACP5N2_04710 [Candidatus Nanoarchaeia archaeon]